MKKSISIVLLLFAIVVLATWQYRLLSLLFFVILNKRWIKEKIRVPYKVIVWGLILCIFIAIPNYFQKGRTQLIYLDKEGERISTPLHVYLVNALLPEEEMMNFAQEDADMYSLVLDAYKLPKKTAEEAERRNLAIDDASRTAVYSSLKVTRACNRIMKLAYTVVTEGNRMLVTDGGASALLARACQRVAAYNVKINLGGVADPFFKARAQQELERQLADGKALEEEVLKEVDARL